MSIPPEHDAEMTPGVRAFVESLLRRIELLEGEVAKLRAEHDAVKKTPRDSPLPPSSEHPHAMSSRFPTGPNRRGNRVGGRAIPSTNGR